MIRIRLENRNVIITNVRHSVCRWLFVLDNNGKVVKSNVIPPEALEYGARVTIENLSEEDINRYQPVQENNPSEALKVAIASLETVLSRRYGIEDPRQARMFGGWLFRSRLIKQHLGLDDIQDEEYSKENQVHSNVAEGLLILNYAMRPISLTYPVEVEEESQATVEEVVIRPPVNDGKISIVKPKKDFEG